jgi:chemotaxis protein MotB
MANDSIIIKKKKVVGHGGHHGGSWKVAYADFVTAMMAFFMVLWIMGLSDDNKASIQGYFNDPAGFMKNPPVSKTVIKLQGESNSIPSRQRNQGQGIGDYKGTDPIEEIEGAVVKKEIANRLYRIKQMNHVIVSESAEGIQIEFLEDVTSVFFKTGSAEISPLGRQIIKSVVPIVKDTGRFMVLEGHTDRKPYAGKDYTNWELSTDRASAFRKELARDGIPLNRFKEVRGYADQRLKFPSKPFAAGNRRVTLLLPWGKRAVEANRKAIQNSKAREDVGPKDVPKFNIFGKKTSEPHL